MSTERTSRILEAAIQGFIDTGEPISSGWLFRQYNFGIRPAMIRRELEILSEEGYLEQPHHSAGRVPTDKGYEFFAETVIEKESGAAPVFRGATALAVKKLASFLEKNALPDFLEEFSENFGLAGAVRASESTYKGGIESLVEGFDWETPAEIKSVMRDFVALDERMEKLTEDLFSGEPRVFFGRKSPVTKSECLATIFGSYGHGKNRTFIVAIGPKRMDYKKTIKTFKGLAAKK